MTEPELMSMVEQRIRQRFATVQITGAGAVIVTGTGGSYTVSLDSPPPAPPVRLTSLPPVSDRTNWTGGQYGQDPLLTINWLGAVNATYWKINSLQPSPATPYVLATPTPTKITAQVTINVSTLDFKTRGDTEGDIPVINLISSIGVANADLIVTGTDFDFGDSDPKTMTAGNPGTYVLTCELAQWNNAGEDPPYTADDPQDLGDENDPYTIWYNREALNKLFVSGVYGWSSQGPPFAAGAFSLLSTGVLNR